MVDSAPLPAIKKRRIQFLGIPVDIVQPDHLDDVLRALLKNPGSNQIIFLRTMDVLDARRRPYLRKCLEEAALVLPVSMGICKAAAKLRLGKVYRYFPFSVVIRLLNLLEEINGGLYILGDQTPYTQIVEKNLKQTFPGMRIVGRYTGNYPPVMHKGIITAIAKASPNVLLCGSGLKGKSLWIHRRRKAFPVGVQVWSAECYDYFTARRKRPVSVAFRKGHEFYRESSGKPWRVFRFMRHVWFRLLVLGYRVARPV